MRSAPLSSEWEDEVDSGGLQHGRVRLDGEGHAALPDPTTPTSFDGDTARALGLYAYNVARKFFPYRPDLVEEAVQETLTRTCERWERATARGKPEAWVVNTAAHVCQEKLREEARGGRLSRATSPSDDGDDLVRSALLASALLKLSRRQRMVVVWRYLFDFSVRDTATALTMTESQVRDASHNGVERLRKLLGEQWSDE